MNNKFILQNTGQVSSTLSVPSCEAVRSLLWQG